MRPFLLKQKEADSGESARITNERLLSGITSYHAIECYADSGWAERIASVG
jgi:hypothetical protein